jgi:RNA polymerase sigma-70 factor (ECF subfamily)
MRSSVLGRSQTRPERQYTVVMRDADQRTDAALLAATAHEPEAFAVFYRRHARMVLGFVVRRVRDPELAADITSEVFAAALEGSRRFDPKRASARTWLFGIVAHQLAGAARRGAAQTRMRRRLGMEPIELPEDQARWIESLAAEQEGVEVRQLLDELPESDRLLLEQRVLAGRDYGELAAELGVAEATVRKRVSRGLGVLRLRFHEGEVAP